MRLLISESGIDLAVPESICDVVMRKLAMYRLRADVEMTVLDTNWRAIAVKHDADVRMLEHAGLLPENRLNASITKFNVIANSIGGGCSEVFATASDMDVAGIGAINALDEAAWRQARIAAGLPDIDASNGEQFTPHMLNLDRSGSISFEKGCYTGQEVIARTQHLGASKRRLMRYRILADEISVGDSLDDGEQKVGTVVNVAEDQLLAVTPVALHDKTIFWRGNPAEPLGLSYPD
jgi:folate-binding protein YgfZ